MVDKTSFVRDLNAELSEDLSRRNVVERSYEKNRKKTDADDSVAAFRRKSISHYSPIHLVSLSALEEHETYNDYVVLFAIIFTYI